MTEEDCDAEVWEGSESARPAAEELHTGVDGLARGVGDPMLEVSEDVG